MLAGVVPALDAAPTSADKLDVYIRSCIEYFGTHRVALRALASLGTGYRPSDGRRFEELGLRPDIAAQLAALDPAIILRAGRKNGEFGDFPVESIATAVRGAVYGVVEKILQEPGYDARGYGEDLVEMFSRVVRGAR